MLISRMAFSMEYFALMLSAVLHTALSIDEQDHRTGTVPCRPSWMEGTKQPGFCISMDDLRSNICGAKMEASFSPDCGGLDGRLCCYSPGKFSLDRQSQNAAQNNQNAYQSSVQPGGTLRCGLPSALPAYPIEAMKQHGAHYGYLVMKNTSVTTNPVYNYAAMVDKATLFPGTDISADVQDVTQYLYDSPSSSCRGRWGPYWVGVDGRVMEHDFGTVLGQYLYDDYVSVEISTSCNAVNSKTGMCSKPEIFVNTRTRPDQLTSQEKAKIDQIVDSTLKPYCLSRKDLLEHQWNAALPLCSKQNEDACYTRMMRGIKDGVKSGSYVDSAS